MKITQDEWLEITEEYYEQMLEMLPPLHMSHNKFISSEPYRANKEGENLYFVGREISGTFQARLMTVNDYKMV